MVIRLLTLIILLAQSQLSLAQQSGDTKATTGKLDFNYYRDTRSYNVMTINLLADFKKRFQYFSLVDYFSDLKSAESTDTNRFYTEQNLRYYLSDDKLVALSSQAVMASGQRNDLFRAGLLLNVSSLPFWKNFFETHSFNFGSNIFPVQLDYQDGFGWQIEYFYSILIAPRVFDERLYLAGFADQNMQRGEILWVTEHQLGYRVYDNFFAVTEYRINEGFEKKTGFGIGLEFLLPF
jgi:hypothetical protein